MSENSELIKKQIKELENQLKFAKQQEFLHSLKNYKWIANLTKDKQIFIHYEYNDDKSYPNFNAYDYFNDNDLTVFIDQKYESCVEIMSNIFMIYNKNMILSKSIDDLLFFQKDFELNIDFQSLKQNCEYEIFNLKKHLDKFIEIKDKLK